MFILTENKGFQIMFENGYTISVQFDLHNYCSNYNCVDFTEFATQMYRENDICEPYGYGIATYVTADEVGKIIAYLITL